MAAVMASSMAMQAQVQAPLLQQQLMTQQHTPGPARLRAYTQVMRIFMQGSYDLAKEEALASLRSALAISEQEHLSVKAAAMAETQHHLQLHPQASQAPEPQAAHPSQAPAAARAPAAGTKRPPPPVATKPAAAPRKRTRASEAGAASRAGARAQATGPASPAPRAVPGAGVEVDPLVGHVVMRYWPTDGGWFKGVISDFRPQLGDHCIIYDIGSTTESFEWYNIRGASQQDCIVQEDKVDFASLAPPSASAAAAAASRAKKAPAGAAAGATPRSSAAAKQPQASVGSASKAGATRPAGSAKPAGTGKPAAARAASARPAARASPPAAPQQAPAAQPVVASMEQPQQAQPQQAQPQQQQPARNGKTSSHHHSHRNGLTSHAAAVKQALAAGGRPPYLNGHRLLPRRTRNWSSDEDSSSDDE